MNGFFPFQFQTLEVQAKDFSSPLVSSGNPIQESLGFDGRHPVQVDGGVPPNDFRAEVFGELEDDTAFFITLGQKDPISAERYGRHCIGGLIVG